MLSVNRRTEYAVSLLIALSNCKTGFLSLRQVSISTKIPISVLKQIATKLNKSGIISSNEGVNGGYVLQKSPELISMLDVLISVENWHSLVNCGKNKNCSLIKICQVKSAWGKFDQIIQQSLQQTTIQSIIDG